MARTTFLAVLTASAIAATHAEYPFDNCTNPLDGSIQDQVDQVFFCYGHLSLMSKGKISAAVHEVMGLTNPDNFYRAFWWQQYTAVNNHSTDLRQFFADWMTYSPVPKPPSPEVIKPPSTCNFCPTLQNPTGVPGSPGYYITYWDYVFNTVAGYTLNGLQQDFRTWFTLFLNVRGNYLETPESFPESVRKQWLEYHSGPNTQHPFDINIFNVTSDRFYSFNAFFLRWFRNQPNGESGLDKYRPLSASDASNPLAIVSPCDGGFFYLTHASDGKYALPGKSQDKFDVKDSFGQYGKFFVGGPLLDSLLWFTDFHHLLSPVSGRIVAIYDYPGSYNYDFYNFDPHNPSLPRPPDSDDVAGWYKDIPRHRRHVWVIDAGELGYVGVAAIGFWGVGSIVTSLNQANHTLWDGGISPPAPHLAVGDVIKKGAYLGHFAYGGSSMLLAFQPCVNGRLMSYTFANAAGTPIQYSKHPLQTNVRSHIGTAKPQNIACNHLGDL